MKTSPRQRGSFGEFTDAQRFYSATRQRGRFGEFTDAQRFYFVMEPADAPLPMPDMDAIRAAHEPAPGGASFDH